MKNCNKKEVATSAGPRDHDYIYSEEMDVYRRPNLYFFSWLSWLFNSTVMIYGLGCHQERLWCRLSEGKGIFGACDDEVFAILLTKWRGDRRMLRSPLRNYICPAQSNARTSRCKLVILESYCSPPHLLKSAVIIAETNRTPWQTQTL